MRSLILRVLPTVTGVLYLLGLVRPVQAQYVHVARTEETATGFVLEVEPHWQRGLRAAADSARVTQFDLSALLALTGGVVTASENVKLPGLVPPRVRVLASEYDEIPLPAGPGADTLLAALERPFVDVVGLGLERKVPTGTVVVRLVTYDPLASVLRRYRKVRVRVDFARDVSGRSADRPVYGKSTAAANPHLAVARSVMADGYLFQIPVNDEGVYRIDRSLLESLLGQVGLTLAGIEPADVHLYGNGGAPLPALNSAPRPADLQEVPVLVHTDGTGAFSDLVFYASGPSGWVYDATQTEWEHYVNPFSSANFYFLKIDTENESAARVTDTPFPGYPDAQRFTSVTGRIFKDFDEVLWSREEPSGYTWVSRQIRPAETLDAFEGVPAPGLTSGTVTYRARVAIRANPRAT
ncbi:MAG TPA: hypothetical protein VFG50_17090, partial [Rhodothermales bacterium]|nr:hypothetical protein [Rhodothermales bacterium]